MAIANITVKVCDKAIKDASTYLSLHNDKLLHKMEQVFASNVQLVEEERAEYGIAQAVQDAIANSLIPVTT